MRNQLTQLPRSRRRRRLLRLFSLLGAGCACAPDVPGDTAPPVCSEAGVNRSLRAAEPGEVLIDEVMADPTGNDRNREWLWLSVRGAQGCDLAGVTLQATPTAPGGGRARFFRVDRDVCTAAAGHTRVLLGIVHGRESFAGGGTPLTCARGGRPLPNGAMTLRLTQGAVLLDEVDLPPSLPGATWQRAGSGAP